MENKDKQIEVRQQDNSCDKYPEIEEATEAMRRISTVEETKAKNLFEYAPSYFPIR